MRPSLDPHAKAISPTITRNHSHLDEANVSSLLTEALAADVEAILADDSVVVAADAAVQMETE